MADLLWSPFASGLHIAQMAVKNGVRTVRNALDTSPRPSDVSMNGPAVDLLRPRNRDSAPALPVKIRARPRDEAVRPSLSSPYMREKRQGETFEEWFERSSAEEMARRSAEASRQNAAREATEELQIQQARKAASVRRAKAAEDAQKANDARKAAEEAASKAAAALRPGRLTPQEAARLPAERERMEREAKWRAKNLDKNGRLIGGKYANFTIDPMIAARNNEMFEEELVKARKRANAPRKAAEADKRAADERAWRAATSKLIAERRRIEEYRRQAAIFEAERTVEAEMALEKNKRR